MKKIALSLFVIAASGAYVWNQWGSSPAGELLGTNLALGDGQARILPRRTTSAAVAEPLQPARFVTSDAFGSADARLPAHRAPFATAVAVESSVIPAPPPISVVADSPPPPAGQDSVGLSVASGAAVLATSSVALVDVPLPRLRPVNRATARSALAAAKAGYSDGTYTGPRADAYYGLVRIQAIVRGGRLAGIKVLEYPSDRRTSVAINHQALPMLRDEVIAAQSAGVDVISGATLTSRAFIESIDAALRQATSTL